MYGGVGGGSCEAPPYPHSNFLYLEIGPEKIVHASVDVGILNVNSIRPLKFSLLSISYLYILPLEMDVLVSSKFFKIVLLTRFDIFAFG